ncbi:MAG: hypothetical protein JWM93_2673, partial [Frankiales bacterium]|nr:hypothetical protein [Frankiales bacterium]
MTVPAHSLRAACATATQGAEINRAEALALFNPDRPRNSFVEHLVHKARKYGMPDAEVRDLLAELRKVVALNDAEHGIHTGLADDLSDLARVAHRLEGHGQALTVRSLGRALPVHLRALRESADVLERNRAERAVRYPGEVLEVIGEVRVDAVLGVVELHDLPQFGEQVADDRVGHAVLAGFVHEVLDEAVARPVGVEERERLRAVDLGALGGVVGADADAVMRDAHAASRPSANIASISSICLPSA